MAKTTHLQKTLVTLGALNRDELIHVRDVINDLLAIYDEQPEAAPDDDSSVEIKPRAFGHIEAKMIRGYGPYLYLRRWQGKTLTSTYIGKARS